MSIDFSTDKKPLTEFSLASLADIVFLLLIFFLLTSSFIPQFGIQVNLPKTSTSAPTDAQYVTVIITSEGHYYVDQNQISKEQLLPVIQSSLNGRTSLVLRADEDATVGQFATVASVARALNLRILMATERESFGF
ncbi:MAG: biopolymer transporter ExbD [Bacteroidetes bacterium]|nr:biopolymer transporter ExbD [Bacteroidota bacterium]MCH8246108.1 biopolymer transporter ExbD [Bacteroidota bacterium]